MNIVAPRLSRLSIQFVLDSAAAVVALGTVGCDENPPDRTAARLVRLHEVNNVLAVFGKELGIVDAPKETLDEESQS